MAFVDDLTALLASAAADTDILYVGKPGDPDPDRQMTLLQAALALLVRAGNGSAAAPSVAFAGDTNTGIYREAADQLGLVAGGTRRVRVQNASPHLQVNDGSLRTVWHDGNVAVTTGAAGTTIRYPNGVQVAYGLVALGSRVTNGSGTLADPYRTGTATITFDLAFAAGDITFTATASVNTGTAAARGVTITTQGAPSTTSVLNVQGHCNGSNTTAATVSAIWQAIGRWA